MRAIAEQNSRSDSLWEKRQNEPVRLLMDCFPSSLLVSMYFAIAELLPTVAQHGTLNLGTGLNLQLLAAN